MAGRPRTAERSVAATLTLVLAALLAPTAARAGNVDTNGPVTLLTGKLTGRGDAEALFIFDHVEHKLAVYEVTGKTLKLHFVRNCTYDLSPLKVSIGGQSPTIPEMREIVEGPAGKKPGRKNPDPPQKPKEGEPKDTEPRDPEPGESGREEPEGEKAEVNGTRSDSFTLSLGKIQGRGDGDALYIYNHGTRRLAVYWIRSDVLELLFSRNCSYDFKIKNGLGRMTPKVTAVKGMAEK